MSNLMDCGHEARLHPIVKATFQTRCGCTREFEVPYPPPSKYYFVLKRDPDKMWLQEELAQLPDVETRVFGLTHYGHVKERIDGVIHVLYDELVKNEYDIIARHLDQAESEAVLDTAKDYRDAIAARDESIAYLKEAVAGMREACITAIQNLVHENIGPSVAYGLASAIQAILQLPSTAADEGKRMIAAEARRDIGRYEDEACACVCESLTGRFPHCTIELREAARLIRRRKKQWTSPPDLQRTVPPEGDGKL